MEPVCLEPVSSAPQGLQPNGAIGPSSTSAKHAGCFRNIVCIEIDLPQVKTVDDVPVFAADVLLQEKRRELGLENELDDDSDDKMDFVVTSTSHSNLNDCLAENTQKAASGETQLHEIASSAGIDGEKGDPREKADHVGAFGRSKITDIAEQLENKYKHAYTSTNRKKKALHFSTLGDGYDAGDSFVDDSDVIREYVPRNMRPEFGFYYVNSGPVKLVEVPVSDTEDEDDDESEAESDAAADSDEDNVKEKRKDDEALADDDASSDEDETETEDDEITVLPPASKASQSEKPSENFRGSNFSRLVSDEKQAGSSASQPTKVSRKQLVSKKPTKLKESEAHSGENFTVRKKSTADGNAEQKHKKKKISKVVDGLESAEQKKHSKSTRKRITSASPDDQQVSNAGSEKPKKKMRIASADDSVLPSARDQILNADKVKSKKQSKKVSDTVAADASTASVSERGAEKHATKLNAKQFNLLKSPEATTRSINIKHPVIRTAPIFQQCAATPSTSAANTRAASPSSSHCSSIATDNRRSSSLLGRKGDKVPAESPGKLVLMSGPLRTVDPQSFFSQQIMPQRQGAEVSSVAGIKLAKQSKKADLSVKSSTSENNSSSTSENGTQSLEVPKTPPPLPRIENEMLRLCCTKLINLINERPLNAGTTHFFNNNTEASSSLLEIDWRTLPLRSSERLAIYAHIGAILGLTKNSLASRAARAREKQLEDLINKSVEAMKNILGRLCKESDPKSEKELRACLANKSWQDRVRQYIRFSRLVHGAPINRRERPASVMEDAYLAELFETVIIGDVLASQFDSLLFTADDGALRHKTLQQLKQTYLNDLPSSIPVPSKLGDNFALMFDNGCVRAAVSPAPLSGYERNLPVKASRPASNVNSATSMLSSDASSIGAINKLTFKSEGKPVQLRSNNSSSSTQPPLFQQPSATTISKKNALPTSPVVAGKQQQPQPQQPQPQQRRPISASSSSSIETISPAGFSVNAILSSPSNAAKTDNKQPSAFFAASNISPPLRSAGSAQGRHVGSVTATQRQQQELLDLAAGLARPQPVNVGSEASATQLMQMLAMMQPGSAQQQQQSSVASSSAQQMQSWLEQYTGQQSQQAVNELLNQQLLQMLTCNPQALTQMFGVDGSFAAATSLPASSVPQVEFSNLFRTQPSRQNEQTGVSGARLGPSARAMVADAATSKSATRVPFKNTAKPTSSSNNASRAPK